MDNNIAQPISSPPPQNYSTGFSSEQSGPVGAQKHPVATFFHLVFKIAALIAYIFAFIISDSFVVIFIICVVLLAADFWTVKNVTGRLMVGLRWWSELDEEKDEEVWKFEQSEDRGQFDRIEKTIFWVGLVLGPVFWTLMALAAVLQFSFQWLILVAIALFLTCSNCVGYIKCARSTQEQVKSQATSYFGQLVFSSMFGGGNNNK